MKKQIIESNTEPNKNCLWLTPNGLKRYGKSGWEDLTNGSGSGGEDKVFEIKIKLVSDGDNKKHREFMINDVGWFRGLSDDIGYQIDRLNGEEWENRGEAIKEMFKDIKSYNKLKLTEFMSSGDTEIPISSTEELTYQLMDANGVFGIMLYSKVYTNNENKFFLMVTSYPDGGGSMTFSW